MSPAWTTGIGRRLRRPSGLAAAASACVAVNVGEVVALRTISMVSTLPLAAQAGSVPVVGAFHDIRWLVVYASSWPALAGEVVAAVAFRAALAAAVIRATWPDRAAVPAWGRLLARNAVAALVLLIVMSPWAVLSFVTAVSSLSFPLLGGLFGAFVLGTFLTAHAGIAPRWWTRWPSWRAMGWTAADFAVVTTGAVGIAYSPGWVLLLPAVVAGALDGGCWARLVRACAEAATAHRRRRRRLDDLARLAVVPLSLFVVITGLPVAAASAVPALGQPYPPAHRLSQDPPTGGDPAVLVADGFESNWWGNTPVEEFPGFYTTEFSYAGQAPDGDPLAYSSKDTTQALPVLAARMASQVTRLYRLTHQRVDIVAVSEGTFVVREYLTTHPTPPVHVVVLASALPRPDRVYYPPLGRSSGYGLLGGWEAHALLDVATDEDPEEDIQTTMPMIRSLVAQGPLFRQQSLCPVPGIRIVALLPLTAAVDTPPGPVGGVPEGVVPSIHGSIVTSRTVRDELVSVLRGKAMSHFFGWRLAFQLARYASSAWEVPSLPLDAVPAWKEVGGSRSGDAAFGIYGCRALDHPSVRVNGQSMAARHAARQ